MICRVILFIFMLNPLTVLCQKGIPKTDLSPVGKLKRDIEYLASDELEGRRAGSKGEIMAAEYIKSRFEELNIQPYQSASYISEFTIKDGIKVGSQSYFKVNETKLQIGKEVIPMSYGSGDRIRGSALPFVEEKDNLWLVSMKSIQSDISGKPSLLLYEYAKECILRGATTVVFFNDIDPAKDVNESGNQLKFEPLSKPIVVINHSAYLSTIKPNMKKDWIDIEAKLGYEDANLTARNVIGFLDNQAPLTIVFSANYDHFGKNGEIYNGANNNASGVASLLAMAEMIKLNGLKQYNYLFLALSGSKFNNAGVNNFLKENSRNIQTYNCLLDLNMLGRFNKVLKLLYVTGVGTSNLWGAILEKNKKDFVLKIDSAGVGYGAYSSFYKKNIPILSLSTGYSSDYAKATDDVSKINYHSQVEINNFIFRIITDLEQLSKLNFTETINIAEKLENLKNDLGFIPDYSFPDNGIRIATCLTNKLADKAGLESDDIIIQIAEFRIIDFDDYIEAMNKLEKGREVAITVKRGKNEFKYFVVL